MDPGSRRQMWDLIATTMKHRSVILTTHSMEECEALCHRIGIMVGGRLRCLGSTTHLKNVHGDGYQLDVNVPAGEMQNSFRQELVTIWPEMKVLEQHGDAFKFRLPRASQGKRTTIGQVFRLMENFKHKYGIRDYSISETTLEQIFIHFARQQEEETGAIAGLSPEPVSVPAAETAAEPAAETAAKPTADPVADPAAAAVTALPPSSSPVPELPELGPSSV